MIRCQHCKYWEPKTEKCGIKIVGTNGRGAIFKETSPNFGCADGVLLSTYECPAREYNDLVWRMRR